MKRIKHILIVIAFMGASLPCLHAELHERHDHADTDGKSICALPMDTSACHSCDETNCEFKMQSTSVSSAQSLAMKPSPVALFILPEIRLSIRQPVVATQGALATLQSVRLLI